MPNHALAVLTGHLARDPELRYINDKPILRFTIGVSTGYGDKKTTTWWKCSAFGERYAKISSYISKGKAVTVIGEPSTQAWNDNNGLQRIDAVLRVNDIVLISNDRRDDHSNTQADTPQHAQAAAAPADDSIPF